jgi:hypothetical protein
VTINLPSKHHFLIIDGPKKVPWKIFEVFQIIFSQTAAKMASKSINKHKKRFSTNLLVQALYRYVKYTILMIEYYSWTQQVISFVTLLRKRVTMPTSVANFWQRFSARSAQKFRRWRKNSATTIFSIKDWFNWCIQRFFYA